MTSTLLIELGCEEIPARFCQPLLDQFATAVHTALQQANLLDTLNPVNPYATSRRLAVVVDGLMTQQPTQKIYQRGPAVSAPESAVLGFSKKLGYTPDDLIQADHNGTAYWFLDQTQPGKLAIDCLPSLLTDCVHALKLPIEMHWGEHNGPFIRPVHWVCALLNDTVIPLTLFGIPSDRVTHGHRFLSAGDTPMGVAISLSHATDYSQALMDHRVMVCPEHRRACIQESMNHYLVNQLVYLSEWPTVLTGRIHTKNLPLDVVKTCIETHQKAVLLDADQFAFVADSVTEANTDTIIQGNERVVAARLSDAAFFYESDLKTDLIDYQKKLATIAFQDQFGSMADKTQRIRSLALSLAHLTLGDINIETIERIANHCKCDLATGMVGEFPSLQGTMGQHYYTQQNPDDAATGTGIFEHYLPRFATDTLPTLPEAVIVGIADRLDTLLCCFYNGLIPTGSKDPWALRRIMNSLCQLCIANPALKLPINTLLKLALETLQNQVRTLKNTDTAYTDAVQFFEQRIYQYLKTTEVGPMAFGCEITKKTTIRGLYNRAQALTTEKEKNPERFARIHASAHRIAKLLANQEQPSSIINETLLTQHEKNLYTILNHKNVSSITDYSEFLESIRFEYWDQIAIQLDDFFEHVMVMDPDPALRTNRIELLHSVRSRFADLGIDWTKIQP